MSFSSAVNGPSSREHWEAILTVDYHKIEKALSLRAPRAGFGEDWIAGSFTRNLEFYKQQFGDSELYQNCLRALIDYIKFNEKHGYPVSEIKRKAEKLGCDGLVGSSSGGATITVTKSAILAYINFNYRAFLESRHSVRDFSPEPVNRNLVQEAISFALNTPSVCNRQGWFVYAMDSKEQILAALRHQRGNTGFAEQISVLLLVTADLAVMHDAVERFQPWIDGGMFAMSLVNALHSQGLGTCCLNLSIGPEDEQALRSTTGIKDVHTPLMMIAIGNLPEKLQVARSKRKSIDQVLHWQ